MANAPKSGSHVNSAMSAAKRRVSKAFSTSPSRSRSGSTQGLPFYNPEVVRLQKEYDKALVGGKLSIGVLKKHMSEVIDSADGDTVCTVDGMVRASSIGAEARQASVKHDDRTACLEHVRYVDLG
jgi:hypothetical protein